MIKVIDDKKKEAAEWFEDLNVGDTFTYFGQLYIKCDTIRDLALNLSNGGEMEELTANLPVIPVDVEIKIIKKVEF